jgi:EAL domain-containing protein (putative c-di-GMP-specific phosphodiesterase class I)
VVTNKYDQAIVKSITTLAQSLGLGVVAEGVETAEQRDFLLTVHAPMAQGFYFSRPLSAENFTQLVLALPEHSSFAQSSRAVSLYR